MERFIELDDLSETKNLEVYGIFMHGLYHVQFSVDVILSVGLYFSSMNASVIGCW